jgi:hypothetical protein
VVLPRESLNDLDPEYANPSVKLVANCELMLFQRPDDAIHRGADRQAEADIASGGTFVSNYEPIPFDQAVGIVEHVVEFDRYTDPMKRLLEGFASGDNGGPSHVVSSAHPRLVDGKPSKNPRYLQPVPDLLNPLNKHLAEVGLRLARSMPPNKPVVTPVDAVLFGRRNNPPDSLPGAP